MNIWVLPQVLLAAEAILATAQLVRLEHPDWTPHERMQEARARCVGDVIAAIAEIDTATAMAIRADGCRPGRGTPWLANYHAKRKAAAAARYERIRTLARLHPNWTSGQLAEHVGITREAVNAALQGSGIRMAGHKGGRPKGDQNGKARRGEATIPPTMEAPGAGARAGRKMRPAGRLCPGRSK